MSKSSKGLGHPLVRVVLIAFAICCIGTAAVYTAFFAGTIGWSKALLAGAAYGAVFGAVATIVISVLYMIGLRRSAGKAFLGAYDLQKVETFVIDLPLEPAQLRAAEAIAEISGAKVEGLNKETGALVAKTGMSVRSLGELIQVHLLPETEGKTRVVIRSRPKVVASRVDGGKNVENVALIAHRLRGLK